MLAVQLDGPLHRFPVTPYARNATKRHPPTIPATKSSIIPRETGGADQLTAIVAAAIEGTTMANVSS